MASEGSTKPAAASSSKRQAQGLETDKNEASQVKKSQKVTVELTEPPNYASQEYWESRYHRNLIKKSDSSKSDGDGDDDALPYHAWYFTYNDLRPLIHPLILGGNREIQDILKGLPAHQEPRKGPTTGSMENATKDVTDNSTNNDSTNNMGSERSSDLNRDTKEDDLLDETTDQDEFVEVDDCDSSGGSHDEEALPEREGLASDGPIAILELGCGDVPLGAGLTLEFLEWEKSLGCKASSVVREVLCTDYSQAAIDAMKREYRTLEKDEELPPSTADIGSFPLYFAKLDARSMALPDQSFELIFEKGVLDAVLSDKECGVPDSIQIIQECARVLKSRGALLLVSHLNAHTDRGIGWLQDVVFVGLRKGAPAANWEIEVHGNDEPVEESDEDHPGVPPGTPGPAVYIIHKLKPNDGDHKSNPRETIPVRFYAY